MRASNLSVENLALTQPPLLPDDGILSSLAGDDFRLPPSPHTGSAAEQQHAAAPSPRSRRVAAECEARRARRAKRRREKKGAGAEAYAALLAACRTHTHEIELSQTALFETSGGQSEQAVRDAESMRLWINDVSGAHREFGEAEAAAILSNIGFTLPPRDFEDIFDEVDNDNSGTLSHDELPRLLDVYRQLGWSHHIDPYGGLSYHVKRATDHHRERVVWEGAHRTGYDDGSDRRVCFIPFIIVRILLTFDSFDTLGTPTSFYSSESDGGEQISPSLGPTEVVSPVEYGDPSAFDLPPELAEWGL